MGKVNSWGTNFPRRTRFSNGAQKTIQMPQNKKSNNRIDADGGVSKEEELVHARDEDGPGEADYPSTEGRRWHRGIICVGDRRTDFWIWGFVLKRKGRWVNVWVVVVIDNNALYVFRQNVCFGTPGGEEIS